jgi:hypothetical protein
MKWLWLGICLMIYGPVTDKTGADDGPTSSPELKSPELPQWESLLPPEDLSGWKILGGSARYLIEDSMVIGQSTPNSPNTWLITERQFGDFELEYEFLCDPKLNSGVQIRSEAAGSSARGFQVEIDVDDQRKRFWSAGLYEEGDRGWIDDLKDNPQARAAHKPHGWNHVRVVAVGAHLQTWLNGVAAAEVFDTRRLSGFIGLQVHGVGIVRTRWRSVGGAYGSAISVLIGGPPCHSRVTRTGPSRSRCPNIARPFVSICPPKRTPQRCPSNGEDRSSSIS